MISIRLANDSDNSQLLDLEKTCPQGTNLVLSFDRTPDFFARSRVYDDYKIYVAEEKGKIVGTIGAASKEFNIEGKAAKGLYIYDLRVHPNEQRKGIGSRLVQRAMSKENEANLAYAIIMEGNHPSIALFSKLGFQKVRDFILFNIPVFKRKMRASLNARTMTAEDLPQVVDLLNSYYSGHDFFAPLTSEDFLNKISRLPGYGLTKIQVVEAGNRFCASAGLWDYSEIFRVIVLRFSLKLSMLRYFLKFIGAFKETMRPPAIGEPFRVMYVKDCAFAQNACEAKELIDHCLGIAYSHKCNFLSFALDPSEPIISAIAEYKPIKVISHLYGRIFGDESLRTTQPIYVDPMDL